MNAQATNQRNAPTYENKISTQKQNQSFQNGNGWRNIRNHCSSRNIFKSKQTSNERLELCRFVILEETTKNMEKFCVFLVFMDTVSVSFHLKITKRTKLVGFDSFSKDSASSLNFS